MLESENRVAERSKEKKFMDLNKIEEMARRRGRPFRLLIVDDEPYVRDVFKEFCEISDFVSADLAKNGQDAVEMASRQEYDLVTMDLIMPEMAGVEAVAKIKEMRPHLPVIVITGNATEHLVNQAGIKGADALLYKPVMLEDFVNEIAATLRKSVP
jgi:two-component system chemotaxis response regulator CheY